MQIHVTELKHITIVRLVGKITLGEKSASLRGIVGELVDKGHKNILLDLGKVTYIDSAGIGELISAYTTVRNRGGELKLLHLTKRMHDLLQITKLCTVFEIIGDEATAVDSFAMSHR